MSIFLHLFAAFFSLLFYWNVLLSQTAQRQMNDDECNDRLRPPLNWWIRNVLFCIGMTIANLPVSQYGRSMHSIHQKCSPTPTNWGLPRNLHVKYSCSVHAIGSLFNKTFITTTIATTTSITTINNLNIMNNLNNSINHCKTNGSRDEWIFTINY